MWKNTCRKSNPSIHWDLFSSSSEFMPFFFHSASLTLIHTRVTFRLFLCCLRSTYCQDLFEYQQRVICIFWVYFFLDVEKGLFDGIRSYFSSKKQHGKITLPSFQKSLLLVVNLKAEGILASHVSTAKTKLQWFHIPRQPSPVMSSALTSYWSRSL